MLITGILTFNKVLLFITISAILTGPIFCGWMCFLGFYQDAFGYLGKFLKLKKFEPPEKLQSVLKYSRYLLFAGSITIGGVFLFPGSVWGTAFGVVKGHIFINTAFYFLIALGITSLFTKRFFCRYFCTFGAKLGLYSLLRPITINRKDTCINCGRCKEVCLMGINVNTSNSLADPNCINCLKCVETCPNNSLKIGLKNYLTP